MEIKVLGSGCSNCKKLLALTEEAVQELQSDANIIYVTDMVQIAEANILRTPGLIINGKIVSYGRIPSVEEIKTFIKNA